MEDVEVNIGAANENTMNPNTIPAAISTKIKTFSSTVNSPYYNLMVEARAGIMDGKN